MSDRGDDIRATAEKLGHDAEQLQKIEEAKVDLPEDDPQVVELSKEAVRLTESMAQTARIELAVAKAPDGR